MNKNLYRTLAFISVLPLIFIATTLKTAIIAGVVVLLLSVIIRFASILIDKFSEDRFNIYAKLLLSAGIISLATIIIQTYLSNTELLAVYLSLMLFNFQVLQNNEVKLNIKESIYVYLISFGLIILIGLLREVLGTGSLDLFGNVISLFDAQYGIGFLKANSGGFILSGFVFGFIQMIEFKSKEEENVI